MDRSDDLSQSLEDQGNEKDDEALEIFLNMVLLWFGTIKNLICGLFPEDDSPASDLKKMPTKLFIKQCLTEETEQRVFFQFVFAMKTGNFRGLVKASQIAATEALIWQAERYYGEKFRSTDRKKLSAIIQKRLPKGQLTILGLIMREANID